MVSSLGLGTVELGTDYGLPQGGRLPARPSRSEAVGLLLEAFRRGLDFVDTAPGYGKAEEIVGEALARWGGVPPVVATKLYCPSLAELTYPPALHRGVRRAVESSLRRLGLPRIPLLQIHNASEDALESPEFATVLRELVETGLVEHLGATTYGESATRAAIATPWCETVQLAHSVLDQEPSGRLIGLAVDNGTGVIVRSALLKGVLSERVADLPAKLRPLLPRVAIVEEVSRALAETLAQTALRFVLSDRRVSTVIAGIDRPSYLDEDVAAWEAPPLPPRSRAALAAAHEDSDLTDPGTWGF